MCTRTRTRTREGIGGGICETVNLFYAKLNLDERHPKADKVSLSLTYLNKLHRHTSKLKQTRCAKNTPASAQSRPRKNLQTYFSG